MTGSSSGSSRRARKIAFKSPTSGVKKASVRMKKASRLGSATEGDSHPNETKWQAYFDSTGDNNANNETVRANLFNVVEEDHSQTEAEKGSPNAAGECSEYDVKGLMTQIYQDLHNVAAAQASKVASGEATDENFFPKVLNNPDSFLQEVSVGAASAIKTALFHLHIPEDPQPSNGMAGCLPNDDPACQRYRKLAFYHSWHLFSKLVHSAAFRHAASTLDARTWRDAYVLINQNAVSLTVFAECCALDWWSELMRLNHLFPPTFNFTQYLPPSLPKTPTPHAWVVTDKLEDVHGPTTFAGKPFLHTSQNLYREASFGAVAPPRHWPASLAYPSDPTVLPTATPATHPCVVCHSLTPCACPFPTNTNPLLFELRYYTPKGVGVRALAPIPRGALLGEYLGEIHPARYSGDGVYGLDFSLPSRPVEEVVALVSAARYGNWTRFVNHSCEAAARFVVVRVGGRWRNVLQAVRAIGAFEEVTVDYGEGYWRDRRCVCGAEGCLEGRRGVGGKGEVVGGKGKEGEKEGDVQMDVCED